MSDVINKVKKLLSTYFSVPGKIIYNPNNVFLFSEEMDNYLEGYEKRYVSEW